MTAIRIWICFLLWLVPGPSSMADGTGLIRSRQSGPWSAGSTWERGVTPGSGDRVQVREGHEVLYDENSERVIRSIHVAGTLRFATDLDTRLDVGLIKIQNGDDASENGFDCDAHTPRLPIDRPRPALEVGTALRPVETGHTARVRLVVFDDMDAESCPAIVCCGGRMEFHGAPMDRTWVKLGGEARPGDSALNLSRPVTGWRVGDQVLLTAASNRARKDGETLQPGGGTAPVFSEVRQVRSLDGTTLTLDRPLANAHSEPGGQRGEVANLSRNVIVESSDPLKGRGHTMYHRNSSGSISYAEFRGLGKQGVKGRYPIHFHMVGESMRGSSVVGASIHDSGNRWITIHGTNHLVVRDCVGYRTIGHGFYLEDGTETLNILDRNLAVQAYAGKPLPDQALAFDDNSGAGFWWANSLNAFTRNLAAECDRYGFRYEATPAPIDDLRRRVLLADGRRETIDVRTLPFIRFDENEAHDQLYGIDLGEGTDGVGPDRDHPFVLKNTRLWDCLWAFRPEAPNLLVDGLLIDHCRYGVFQPRGDGHAYQGATIRRTYLAGPAPSTPNEDTSLVPDDTPPTTIVTFVSMAKERTRKVRGTSVDNGSIRRVLVNGRDARAIDRNFLEWEVILEDPEDGVIHAYAEDNSGNIEKNPHRLLLGSQTDDALGSK
ncbi:G8 domain-containing protein [Tundrisphaera lichenicola]|uniref:G8 domain-containing protein n=1 Tax=Tundrisphaera lichenicola TaxID=2029860 RepID=UPI003EC0EECC